MSDAFWIAFFACLSTLFGVVGTALGIWIVNRVNSVQKDVATTHQAVNSRMDELLKISKSSARAEGNLEGRAELTAEEK